MPKYKVAFDINGSVHSVDAGSVKLGNRYLHCKSDAMTGDSETVAMLPFDSVEYIVHKSVAVSGASHDPGHADSRTDEDVNVLGDGN